MSIVLVSGLSGSGKSAVYRQLIELGFEAHGFDEDGFGEWIDTRTGLSVPFPIERTDGDIDHLDFVVHRDKIDELAQSSAGRVVFLCGGAGHEFHFWELVDRVIYLSVDTDTLARRLRGRTDNGYGKTPAELAGILRANETWTEMYRERGAVVVDATKRLDDVVKDVVNAGSDRS